MGLEADAVFFHYHKRQPWILENCSLKIERGERVAVAAPSGYGKTTLALLLAGYLQPVQGRILVDGRPLPAKGRCPVQLIGQHPEQSVNPRWKIRKILEEAGRLEAWIEEGILDTFGIRKEWLERYPGELSGGELQRCCVARAIMSEADYLICDEISTMLDVITQAQIWKGLTEEAAGKQMGLMIITHNRYLAERVADRIVDLGESGK